MSTVTIIQIVALATPYIILLLTRGARQGVQVDSLTKSLEAFRKEYKQESAELRRELQSHSSNLEHRVTKLEVSHHNTRNTLQILVGQVDELRTNHQ